MTVVALALTAMTIVPAGTATADAGDACADRYPEASWSLVSPGSVSIEETGVTPEIAARFAEEIGIAEDWITEEIGPFEATVCLVGAESLFDIDRYLVGSQQFHIITDLEEQLVAMNTDRSTRFVAPAMAFALSQHALYQNNGSQPFSEPIASAISHWYRARILDRLPYYHNDEMTSNFFDTEARLIWAAGEQVIFRSWNPEGNVSSIGDFIEFATRTRGNAILLETDGQVWAEIEGEWRTALRVELTGRSTPTTGWKIGIAIILVVMVGGIGLAIGSVIHARRKRQRPTTEAPIPGFFVDE